MSGILKYKEQTNQSEYAKNLLRAAEQRMNFVYRMIMIAFEASILIYVLFNTWDNTRYYFSGNAGAALLAGILVNVIFRKKNYPWIKYVNNAALMYAVFMLVGLSDPIALLFILIPFINSFYFRPRFTALTGVISLFLLYVSLMSIAEPLFNDDGEVQYNFFRLTAAAFNFTAEETGIILSGRIFIMIMAFALVIVSVYLSVNSRRFTISQGELIEKNLAATAEMNVARNIQEGILSADFPDNASYAVYAEMATATEVGGDFYDYFLIDESHLALVIGDVSGHGMPAAMFMTLSKTLIKVYAQAHHAAGKVLELSNRYLQQSNPAKFFVTGWIGILDLSTGVLTYANAGHNLPVLVRAGRDPAFLRAKPNFVLGRRRLVRYTENRVKLSPGDKLVLYTDGVTEAQSPDGQFFGDDRLLEIIGSEKEHSQKDMLISLRRAVNDFENGGEHSDDATALALYFKDYLQVTPPQSKRFFLTVDNFDSVTDYIAERCTAAGCDETTVGQIVIASSEILANIDMYVYENGGEIELLTKCRDRRMTVVFKDNGKPFNPLLVQEPDVTLPLGERKPGGLGIFIVKKLMSDVSYAYTGNQNVLTIEMDF